ncbi:hypothetical protein ALC56_11980 [Trachymyrmex septentrionalis]|uniref:Uncharacterized protein n=1 Tax=Trachymyrmex septentrionalis TaxID=34720 RepID=A0A195F0N9_9HYME|nr:hypothetical protein ALC56_11980 [Trachymyrmex septentrionalis]
MDKPKTFNDLVCRSFCSSSLETESGRDPKKDLHVLDEIVASMNAKPANLFVRRTTSRPQSGLSSRCSQ